MDFEKTYNNTPDRLKISYLDAIIKNNDTLKQAFIAFVKAEMFASDGMTYEAFAEIIDYTNNLYRNHFESVDTENPDWDSYTPSHAGYIEEWEQYQQASEQEFQEYFQFFLAKAVDMIIAQRPEELLAMLIGLYEAALDADVPDELESFENVHEFLLSEHKEVTNTLAEKLRLAALADNKISKAFELFFRYCKDEFPGNPHFATHFEPVLIALAEKTKNAGQLLEIRAQAGIEQAVLPELTLMLYKAAGNKDAWLLAARQMYRKSDAVAKELLQFYFERDQTAFVEAAHELFSVRAGSWSSFLEPYVTPQLDEQLFVKVFSTLTISRQNIQHYQKVKPYLDEKTYRHILKQVEWDKVFLVKLFAEDERHADIKALVENESDRWHFDQLIAPILSIYPGFCFAKIKTMVENTLANERGRSTYERIAKWLSLAKQIPGHETDAIHLINTTYTHKPNLPALKDEMRKAGLV
jgi:hypothetical protein